MTKADILNKHVPNELDNTIEESIYNAMNEWAEECASEKIKVLSDELKENCWNHIVARLKAMKITFIPETLEKLKKACLK